MATSVKKRVTQEGTFESSRRETFWVEDLSTKKRCEFCGLTLLNKKKETGIEPKQAQLHICKRFKILYQSWVEST